MPPEAALSAPDTSAANLDPNAAPPATSAPVTQTSSQTEDWGKGWIKDGAFDHAALDKAPEDFKGLRKQLETFKSPADLAKSYAELRKLSSDKGSSLLEPLAKDAPQDLKDARMAAIRKAVGAPEKPEGYVIEKPKDLPDAAWDKDAIGKAAQIAHKYGVPSEALTELAHYEVQRSLEAARGQETAMKAMWEGQDKLIREFAAKQGMDYATAKGFAENAGRKWGVEADSPLMQNATVFALLTRLGKAGGEAPLVKGDTNEDNLASLTPETALKALEAIRDDPKNPLWAAYWNRDPENPKKEKVHADHDKVVERVKNLSKLAYANRPVRGR
jgi:hypothetical protein